MSVRLGVRCTLLESNRQCALTAVLVKIPKAQVTQVVMLVEA